MIAPIQPNGSRMRFSAKKPAHNNFSGDTAQSGLSLKKSEPGFPPRIYLKGNGPAASIQDELNKVPKDIPVFVEGNVTGHLNTPGSMIILPHAVVEHAQAAGMLTMGVESKAKTVKGGSLDIHGTIEERAVTDGTVYLRSGARAKNVEGTGWYTLNVLGGATVSDTITSKGDLFIKGRAKRAEAKGYLAISDGGVVEESAVTTENLYVHPSSRIGSGEGRVVVALGQVDHDIRLTGENPFFQFHGNNPVKLTPDSVTKGLTVACDYDKQQPTRDQVWSTIGLSGKPPADIKISVFKERQPDSRY